MNISIDFHGTYTEHRQFFNEMATSMQKQGHRVGLITGERENDVYDGHSLKDQILSEIGFKPDFVHMWGQTETIGNGGLWKARKMDEEDVAMHFDDDAISIKRWTNRWVMKPYTAHELEALSGKVEQTEGVLLT